MGEHIMRTDSHFTKEHLQSLFDYKDGNLYWKKTKGRLKAGSLAGTKSHHYWQICIDYVIYRTHRLVWIFHHGNNPDYIDHINGNTFDNRIENLRECNISQNRHNQKLPKTNTSGVKGVNWSKQKQKWRARVVLDSKEYHVGFFENIEEAQMAISNIREKLHGVFARQV
jgi:HNH endonuclease